MAVIALAYAVDVWLPWVPRRVEAISLPLSGIEMGGATWWSFLTAFALFLSELAIALSGIASGWRDGVAALLALSTAALGLVGVLDARSTSFLHPDHSLGYGAWIAIPLAAALLVGGAAHLAYLRRPVTTKPAE
jgi:hypothetical protein